MTRRIDCKDGEPDCKSRVRGRLIRASEEKGDKENFNRGTVKRGKAVGYVTSLSIEMEKKVGMVILSGSK